MVHNPILFEVLQKASIFLGQKDDNSHLARHYWMELFDWSLTDLVLKMHQPVSDQLVYDYEKALTRLKNDEPIQYIKGYAYFDDKRFKVTSDVLIPREETKGLLDLVKKYRPEDKKYELLDIGTGSGILAIGLALVYPMSHVTATDISSKAMKVAKENQQAHQVTITNYLTDLMADIPTHQQFDIIVSNPPYISHDEVHLMTQNVLKYEPHIALFAEHEGLLVYERLAEQLPRRMKESGLIALEIGFNQGAAVKELFQQAFPEANVICHQDFNGQDRYILIDLKKEG